MQCILGALQEFLYSNFRATIWEFPKIGDPNIVPKVVESLL